MNSRTVLGVMTSMVLCTGIVLSSSFATAQQKSLKEQLIGTWTIVSNDNVAPDGTKRHGTTATFGTWSVDEASTTLIVRNEGGMFPNQVGTESKRSVTLAGDQLRIGNPNPASGGRSESVWKRGATVASN